MAGFSTSEGAFAFGFDQTYSGNSYAQVGTIDPDSFSILRDALASGGASATVSSNSVLLEAGAGADAFRVSLRAFAETGGEAITSGNVTTIHAGDGNDGAATVIFNSLSDDQANADGSGSSASSTSNQFTYFGGAGDDFHFHNSVVGASSGGIATSSGNSVDLSGDAGNDRLQGQFSSSAASGGVSHFTGNSLTISGGDGVDSFVAVIRSSTTNGTASSTGNSISIVMGAEDDGYRLDGGSISPLGGVQLLAVSNSSGSSTTSNNVVSMSLGGGNDNGDHSLFSQASSSGTSTLADNSVTSDAGDGDDDLSFVYFFQSNGLGSQVAGTGNVSTIVLGAGSDAMVALHTVTALDAGATTYSGNSHSVSGGAGSDQIQSFVSLHAGFYFNDDFSGGTVDWSNNFTAIDTGADGGTVSAQIFVSAAEGGFATVTGNSHALSGGSGSDSLSLGYNGVNGSIANGTDGGTITISGNIDTASGGGGNDTFTYALAGQAVVGGSTSVTGNNYSADGGDGSDSFVLALSSGGIDVANNVMAVDGGNGTDSFFVNFGLGTHDNNVTILGGAGNDAISSRDDGANVRLFVGGAGDDTIQDHSGFSTAGFEGTHDQYRVVDLGDGWVQVTDLRPDSPDGTDRLFQVDQLRFADGDFTVAELLADTIRPDAPTLDLAAASDSGASDIDNITSDTTPTLTGVAEALSIVEVFEGMTSLGTTTADAAGNWSLTVATPMIEGVHNLQSTATDEAGNVSTASLTLTITLDASMPAPTIDLAAASDSGSSDSDDLTNRTSPTLSGTGEPNSFVSIYQGTAFLGMAVVDGSGNWSLPLGATLADGAHTLHAVTEDVAGNQATSADMTITVDTIIAAPTIEQTSATSDAFANLEGTAEAGATVAIRDSGGNLVGTAIADAATGVWTFEFATALLDGEYEFSATATDSAGNVSATVSAPVSIILEGNVVNGGNGEDSIVGSDARDTLNGGNGVDSLSGGWAPDQLFGGNGDDALDGGAGGDSLFGENGNDRLDGGFGMDRLEGGRGDDLLIGGPDSDTFVFGKNSGNDIVQDFTLGEDRFELADDISVASFAVSGSDTIVTLSSGGTVTLLGVTLVGIEDLFPVDPMTATLLTSPFGSDAMLV